MIRNIFLLAFFALVFPSISSAATFRFSPASGTLPTSTTPVKVSGFLNTQSQPINSYQVIINYSYTGLQDITQNQTTITTTSSDFSFCQNAITHSPSTKTGRIVVGCLVSVGGTFNTSTDREMFNFQVPTTGQFTFTFDTSTSGSKVEPQSSGPLVISQNPVVYTFTTPPSPTLIPPTPTLTRTPTRTPSPIPSTPTPTITPPVSGNGSLTISLSTPGLPSTKNLPTSYVASVKIGLTTSTQDLINIDTAIFTHSQGTFSFTTPVIIQPNTYRITISKPFYLDRVINSLAIKSGSNSINATFLPGDFSCDNRLTIEDISAQLSSFSSLSTPTAPQTAKFDLDNDSKISLDDIAPVLSSYTQLVVAGDGPTRSNCTSITNSPTPSLASPTPRSTSTPVPVPSSPTPTHSVSSSGESMAMMAWRVGGKNSPNPSYDKCDDGPDVVQAHNQYYVIAYDGLKYPTWHPPVVTNPVTGVGKCYFGHEHGLNPSGYIFWSEIVQHFGKDLNNDGQIVSMQVNTSTGVITPGDRAGLPFGIANEHMEMYYNQEGHDSIFVRHEDHVGHKLEYVNSENDYNIDKDGTTLSPNNKVMSQIGNWGLSVPVGPSENYLQTGITCAHFHKFHQGTHSIDAIRNNLHEVIFHSKCDSINGYRSENVELYYPDNVVLLTGMMAFGKPGEYTRFCYASRTTDICVDGKNPDGSCKINDPLIAKLPPPLNTNSLGRNIVDRHCGENWYTYNPGNFNFDPYEIWEGDFQITTPTGKAIAKHGRQWDVLDPIRFVDPLSSTGQGYNSQQCATGGIYDEITYVGGCNPRTNNRPWDSPTSLHRGLKRTTYFGRNEIYNKNSPTVYWTNPLGGAAVTTPFSSGLKQYISNVDAYICSTQDGYATNLGNICSSLNDRAIQRVFNTGNNTVHAPN